MSGDDNGAGPFIPSHGRCGTTPEERVNYWWRRAKTAEARLDKVRALHSPVAPSPSRPWVTCSGCTNGGPYPCPTIQAIAGSDQ